MIPLYDSLGIETISYVIGHANLQNCFCSKEGLDMILKSGNLFNLKHLVVFDEITPEQRTLAEKRNLSVRTWKELLEVGRQNTKPYAEKIELDDVFTFSYTSGTTGDPKGAMISQKNFVAVITAVQNSDVRLFPKDVCLSYLPLPHIMERLLVWTGIYVGA